MLILVVVTVNGPTGCNRNSGTAGDSMPIETVGSSTSSNQEPEVDANGGEVPQADENSIAAPDRQEAWPFFRGTANSVAFSNQSMGESIDLIWEYFLDDGGFIGSPVIDRDTIYAVDMDGQAIAIDLQTGTRKWIQDLDVFVDASPALIGQRLVFGDLDGKLFCLETEQGDTVWSIQTESAFATSVNEYKDNVLAITEGGDLLYLSIEDGSEIWSTRIEDRIISSPSIAEDFCFLTGCNSLLYVVSLKDGKLDKSIPIPAPTGVTAAVVEDHLYFSTSGGTVFCYDWKTGEQIWDRFDPRGAQEVASCPAINDELLVIGGGSNRQLIAVNRESGEDLWQFTARRMVDSSPILVGNVAIVGSHDGRAYFIDAQSGDKLFEFECGGIIANAPATLNAKVVIANNQGGIFCFGRAN